LIKEIKIFERLKSKSDIGAVYKKGSLIISVDRKLKANLLSTMSRTNKIRVAISISSKTGNSVWRNRFKRIIRESLRQEKEILKEIVSKNKLEISIIFSPYRINQANLQFLNLKDIKLAVSDILNKISKTNIRN
jgi:ribonuclease P protein component